MIVIMESIWKVAFKVTGAVGVVGYLFSSLIKELFRQEIIELFGDERMFYIAVLLVCIFGIAIIVAILQRNAVRGGSPKVVYKGRSRHNGDNRF